MSGGGQRNKAGNVRIIQPDVYQDKSDTICGKIQYFQTVLGTVHEIMVTRIILCTEQSNKFTNFVLKMPKFST